MNDKLINHDWSAVLAQLVAQAQELQPAITVTRAPCLVRIETEVPFSVDLLQWLAAQQENTAGDMQHYFWRERDGSFAMAGIGEADKLNPDDVPDATNVFEMMRSRLRQGHEHARYYGGFRFHGGTMKGDRWKPFKAFRFVAPRLDLYEQPAGLSIGWNFLAGSEKAPALEEMLIRDVEEAIARYESRGSSQASWGDSLAGKREDLPDRQAWTLLVKKALAAIERRHVEKVVLARETCFTAEGRWDPVRLLQRLIPHAPNTFQFCFHPAPGRAFLGASPERLYKRQRRRLQSEALAGTYPRARTDVADSALSDALLNDQKERAEHQFVVRMLRENLEQLCDLVDVGETSIMKLKHMQHLHTPIEGTLRIDNGDAALISTLHPTPAVGGVPRENALQWLSEQEPFDRGIYAAPVGWVGRDETEFCVAIRSGLIKENVLCLYNGAGIVRGSTPEKEWAEIETKMQTFMDALTGESAR